MRVLVTGAGGFLGGHIVDALRAAGHEVVAPGRHELDLRAFAAPWSSSVQAATDAVAASQRVDAIVHAASRVGGLGFVGRDPNDLLQVNSLVHLGAIALTCALEPKVFVGIGSACTYPGRLCQAGALLTEDALHDGDPDPSVLAYAASKRLLDHLQQTWALETGGTSWHLIPANLYGPGDRMSEARAHAATALLRRFVRATREDAPEVRVWGDGTAEREFLYVADAAAAVVAALAAPPSPGDHHRVNVGTGVSTPIRAYVDELVTAAAYPGRVVWDADRPQGVGRKLLAVDKARSLLGWHASTSLSDGLRQAVAWERAWQAGDPP